MKSFSTSAIIQGCLRDCFRSSTATYPQAQLLLTSGPSSVAYAAVDGRFNSDIRHSFPRAIRGTPVISTLLTILRHHLLGAFGHSMCVSRKAVAA